MAHAPLGPGQLTVGGNYTQTTGKLEIELGGTTAGTGYDQLAVGGLATLSGRLDVSLINGFSPALGDHFVVLTYGAHVGNFTTYTGLTVGGA